MRDTALGLGVIAGHDAKDPMTRVAPVPDFAAALSGDIRGLRASVLRQHRTAAMAPEVAASLDRAVRLLAELGARIDTVSVPNLASADATSC